MKIEIRHLRLIAQRMGQALPCAKQLFLSVCFFLLSLSGFSQQSGSGEKVTLEISQTTLSKILDALDQQSKYSFNYIKEDFDRIIVKDYSVENIPLQEALNLLKEKAGFEFSFTGNSFLFRKTALVAPAPKKDPGKVIGKIIDEENGQPIMGATISISNKGATTDENGSFTLYLPRGKYEAEISSVGFGTKRVTEILITDSKTFILDIPLKREKGQLGTVTVSAHRIKETGTNAAIINEIREADAVVSGISKEQIIRSQDRDAAEVVRRIPGVSVMHNRFIVVRGLPQRCNSVMLNGTVAPSFEPDSRAFSFDIMPSSMIDRIMVYKTAVPELPGDFAGGVVKVYTTGMPAKNAFNVTFQTSFLQNTTLKDFYEQPQGSKAWLGYDDGTYAIPTGVKNARDVNGRLDVLPIAERRPLGKLFNDNWDAGQRNAPLDKRFNIDYARRFSLGNKILFGFISAFSYTNTYSHQSTARNTGMYGGANGIFEREYTYADQSYDHAVRLNGLLNLALNIDGKHRIEFKNLYTHLGSSAYIDRIGLAGPLATSRDADKYLPIMCLQTRIEVLIWDS